MKNRFIKYIAALAVLSLTASCTAKFEQYNTNPYEPPTVSPASLLSGMFNVYASPQQNECQYNNTFWACFSGHVTAPNNWSKGTAIFAYYNAIDGFNDGTWGNHYNNIYSSLFRIETMTDRQGVIYAIAQLTRVYAMQTMVSLQGPIPYTQMKSGATAVAYDDEKTAWHALFSDLDDVISTLMSADGVNPDLAKVDRFYGGDCTKWLKFANTLKLRMAMRISGVEPQFAKQMAEEAVAAGVMESVSDSSWDTTNGGQPNGYNIVAGWNEVRANACLVSCMNGYNDPRREKYFTEQKQTSEGGYVGVRSGSADIPETAIYANYSNLKCAMDRQAPMIVMYAAESAFLRAEGALKGWNMGGTAQEFYERGVRLSFDEFEVAGADAYLADATSVPAAYTDNLIANHSGNNHPAMSDITIKWDESASAEKKLERVLTQKWIALFLDPLSGWSDFRRTGYPKIFQATKSANPDCNITRGQRRLRFARSEYNVNQENVEAAVKMLSNGNDSNGTDLWWAMKSNGSY